jgi:two-component system response regulator RegX3
MLTAKDAEIDKVVGLELGADDYVTKPYSSRELIARIKAVLRRGISDADLNGDLEVITVGAIKLDTARHQAFSNGAPVALPLKEFELLEFLMRNSGRVLTRSQLIDRVWGGDYFGDTKTLDVHIKRLRSKLEIDPANPVLIQTIRGLGYKLES